MNNKKAVILAVLLMAACATNILGARYYRLLENERKLFLGLRAIDSTTAMEYLNLQSVPERRVLYDKFWEGKDEARAEFEKRIEYAVREYGAHAPLSDDRIPTYVRYGPPSRRQEISPQKIIAITSREMVRPAEIWTYKNEGVEIDFIRYARAYKIIVQTRSGEREEIPYLKEDTITVLTNYDSTGPLNFRVALGRFRQKKNLTRLEVYLNIIINNDTTGLFYMRNIEIFDQNDNLVAEKKRVVYPANGNTGIFYDEANFWLEPRLYRVMVEMVDLKNNLVGKTEFSVDLLEYAEDAKEISDLVAAKLIDESFTDDKFNKPVGRVIPLTRAETPVYTPFFFYHEAYNLEVKDGMHKLRTTYEIYSKERMRKEIVDILIQDTMEEGDIAYLSAKYHPMDLVAGNYIIVARDKDLISGKERTAVGEFEILGIKD